jgi:L-alanine-DL-glutamate epimerase-like enolase superfamily enzyme
MKIQKVHTAVVTCRYDTTTRNAHYAWNRKQYVLVGVEADGLLGLGEVYCDGQSSPHVIEAILKWELGPRLIGEDSRDIERIRHKLNEGALLSGRPGANTLAASGVDIALWDLLGKQLDQPVYRLLGGFSNQVPVYASGGMYGPDITPARLAEQMAEAIKSGFGGVKMKAAGASLAHDVERVSAVRDAIGESARLMVDAMFVPDVPGAIRLARALDKFDVHFLEAPTRAADISGWARVHAATAIPLAGPELEWSVDIAREYLVASACHFLQFDVNLAGGLSQGRELAGLARAFHRPITLHCVASAIGVAASAHLGAAVSNCDSLEFHVLHQGLHDHLWASGWKLANGVLTVPDRPGLGVDLDPDEFARLQSSAV